MNGQRLMVCVLVGLSAGCGTAPQLVAAPPGNDTIVPPSIARSQQDDTQARVTDSHRQDAVQELPHVDGSITIKIRAIVNNTPILDEELRQATFMQLRETEKEPEPQRSYHRKEIIVHELDRLIEREVVMADAMGRLKGNPRSLEALQEAATKEFEKQLKRMRDNAAKPPYNCETDAQFAELLAAQGLTRDGLKRQIERSFMQMEYMRHRIWDKVEAIGHPDIVKYYEQHPGEFQAEDAVKWQDIFISNSTAEHPNAASARRFAEEIINQVRNGVDFQQLAERYDEGLSKFNHGDGYGSRRGEIKPVEVEAYLFRMRDGEVGPIIEIPERGYHIIRLVSREYAGLQPLDEKTQVTVKKKLQSIIMEREYQRLVKELKEKAAVVILDGDL